MVSTATATVTKLVTITAQASDQTGSGGSGLTPGTLGGLIGGIIGGFLLLAGCGWFFILHRSRRHRRRESRNQPVESGNLTNGISDSGIQGDKEGADSRAMPVESGRLRYMDGT
jgi:hypothetical protein